VSAAEAGYLRTRVFVGFVDVIAERRQLTLKFRALPFSLHTTHDQTTYRLQNSMPEACRLYGHHIRH